MIPAVEALALPSARLTDDEMEAANKLEAEIEAHVSKFMERRGCDFNGKETRPNVLADVNQRLKAAGYNPEWRFMYETHRLNKAIQQLTGFQLTLAPNDDAYRTAAAVRLQSA